jgi:hypothetical protein
MCTAECSTSSISVTSVVLITAGTMFLALVLPALVYAWLKHRRRQVLHERLVKEQLLAAIRTTRSLDCPAIYIRATDFCKLGKLRPHEELRNEGVLVYKDALAQLASVEQFVVFVSHQWTSTAEPDPNCIQYPVMVAAVRKLAQSLVDGEFMGARFLKHGDHSFKGKGDDDEAENKVRRVLANMLVWVDYVSIPQTPCEMQNLAIRTLSSYCSNAAAFIVVAPIATHAQTGQHCNFTSYQTRMWTRAEQFCHAAVHGIDSMWIATSEGAIDKMGSHKLLAMGDRWMTEILHVYEGHATDDMDKVALVIPILGLYAELYACSSDIEKDPTGVNKFLSRLLTVISDHKKTIFPKRTNIMSRPSQTGASGGLHGKASVQHYDGKIVTQGSVVRLFAELVSEMERMLDKDDALRDELRASGLRRRGLTAHLAEEIQKIASRKTTVAPRKKSMFPGAGRGTNFMNSRATRWMSGDAFHAGGQIRASQGPTRPTRPAKVGIGSCRFKSSEDEVMGSVQV